MNITQNSQVVLCAPPAAKVDNATVNTRVIDLAGYDHCEVYVLLGDTDIGITQLLLQESDEKTSDFALASPQTIPGTVVGTDPQADGGASALPTATDDNKVWKFEIKAAGRKRYIKPVVTVGDGTTGAYVTVLAVLQLAEIQKHPAASRGLANLMRA